MDSFFLKITRKALFSCIWKIFNWNLFQLKCFSLQLNSIFTSFLLFPSKPKHNPSNQNLFLYFLRYCMKIAHQNGCNTEYRDLYSVFKIQNQTWSSVPMIFQNLSTIKLVFYIFNVSWWFKKKNQWNVSNAD